MTERTSPLTSFSERWLQLDGAVNVRDLGGLPTRSGATTRFRRVLRGDSPQDLTSEDVRTLVAFGLSDLVDLRSSHEIAIGKPGALAATSVTTHRHSMLALQQLAEIRPRSHTVAEGGWQTGEAYVELFDQPDAVLGALRALADSRQVALVHCLGGIDRTGVVVAAALSVVGVPDDVIVEDYALSHVRVPEIVQRFRGTPEAEYFGLDTSAREPAGTGSSNPGSIMRAFLDLMAERAGGMLDWLAGHGWTSDDTRTLSRRLLER